MIISCNMVVDRRDSLDQDKARHFELDLGPTGVQRLSADVLRVLDRVKPSILKTADPDQTQWNADLIRVSYCLPTDKH